MASLGDLVVNLRANTQQFIRGMKQADAQVSGFASSAVMAASVAAGGWMVKLAADAEQLKLQFESLLGSGDAAAAMMGRITEFSKTTPFQKLGIAEAAKKLLGFGVPAKDVISILRRIGNAAAVTGAPLSELALIYGKVHTRGKLGLEHLMQLQERSVPAIKALAAVTGIAEENIMSMATAGKISADDLAKAFTHLSNEGNTFHGAMDKLSKTFKGQLSTLMDNAIALGEQLGAVLIPELTRMTLLVTEIVTEYREWVPVIAGVIAGFAALRAAVMAFSMAARIAAAAQATVLALSGPAGWAVLATGAALATAAVVKLQESWNALDQKMQNALARAEAHKAAQAGEAAAMAKTTRAAIDQAAAIKKLADEKQNLIDKARETMRGLRDPFASLHKGARELAEGLKLAGFGFDAIRQAVHMFIMQEGGFTDALQEQKDELDKLKGKIDDADIALRRFAQQGVSPKMLQHYRNVVNEIKRIKKEQEDAEKKDPFLDMLAGATAAVRNIAAEDLQAKIDKLEAQKEGFKRSPGAMQRGSAEAMKAIIANQRQADPSLKKLDQQIELAQAQLEELKKKSEFELAIQEGL